jgi:acylphosphatase
MCLRVLVSGKVQGVGYRSFAQRLATHLDVSGHAINVPDGRVEVIVCGSTEAIDNFPLKLEEGPTWSSVGGVNSSPLPCVQPGFRTGRSAQWNSDVFHCSNNVSAKADAVNVE